MKKKTPVAGSWKIRRRFMFVIAAFCMAAISYVLWRNMQGSVAETTITMSFLALISITGSYVFGATWDDNNARSPRS